MSFWGIIALGFVQGICEFLPISSSGHLVLFSSLFGLKDSLFVGVVLHVATLLAVIVVYRKDLWRMIKNPLSNDVVNLAIATIFTCLFALIIMPLLKDSFDGIVLPITFLLSAIILFLAEKMCKNKKSQRLSLKHSVAIGLAQGIALFPGLSRSGTTISTGILSGADKKECAKFSFLLSIPTILGSLLLEIIDFSKSGGQVNVDILGLLVASLVAFVVSLISIKFMIKLTEKTNFKWFALYLSIIAVVSLIIFW